MNIINNIEWYFNEPKYAINRNTRKHITQEELETIVFDGSLHTNVKFCLPLSDDLSFTETRELACPITVEQLLTMIGKFYNEPLKKENFDMAFENNEEWKEEIVERYNGDISKLINYHVFEDTCSPDFCGIHLIEEIGDHLGEYFVNIGPE